MSGYGRTQLQSRGRPAAPLQQAEFQRRLQALGVERMTVGHRIRNLRRALWWTQSMAAAELGISVRTVIRHEKGQHRRPSVGLSLLGRLRDLESAYAEGLSAYLVQVGRRDHLLPRMLMF